MDDFPAARPDRVSFFIAKGGGAGKNGTFSAAVCDFLVYQKKTSNCGTYWEPDPALPACEAVHRVVTEAGWHFNA